MQPLRNILVTGSSGYLGGSLLTAIQTAQLPHYDKLFALVRNNGQARQVQEYGAIPIEIDLNSDEKVKEAVSHHGISIVFWLIDATRSEVQVKFIKSLAEVKKEKGIDVHFLHTTGAKLFSSLVGHPTNQPLLDTDEELFEIQRTAVGPFPAMKGGVEANCRVIEESEAHGVKSYIFAPCIVYGKGSGFGNKISIQTVDIVKAARASGTVHQIDEGDPKWPVCHIGDNTSLYVQILRSILKGEEIGHGKHGYFLAASGRIAWNALYAAMAESLFKRGVVKSREVNPADDQALQSIAGALEVTKEMVRIKIAGACAFTAEHGRKFGWEPRYGPEHILESADAEVELILREFESKNSR